MSLGWEGDMATEQGSSVPNAIPGGAGLPPGGAAGTTKQPALASLLLSWAPLVTPQESDGILLTLWLGDTGISAQGVAGQEQGLELRHTCGQVRALPGTQRVNWASALHSEPQFLHL